MATIVQVKLLTSPQELELAFRLRYEVYCGEKGYLSAEDHPDGLETDEYDAGSVHIGCFVRGELVGYGRVITPSVRPFPIERHFSINEASGHKFQQCEISRLIVRDSYRGSKLRVLLALVRAIVFEAECRHLFCAFAVVEKPLLDFARRTGVLFEQIGPVRYFMGADVIPCMVLAENIQHAKIGLSDNWRMRLDERKADDGMVLVV